MKLLCILLDNKVAKLVPCVQIITYKGKNEILRFYAIEYLKLQS